MDKNARIKNSIKPVVSLTDEELLAFCAGFEVKKLNRNELFLEEGQICNFIGFVNHGAMIYFKTTDNGDEITTDFAFEGDWVTNNLSRLNNSPALISIKAIKACEILIVRQTVLEDFLIKIPKIERLCRILMEQAYLKIVQQSIDLQILSAKQRYETLLQKDPEIFQKVQLYHIANYLGIAPKSLSRIRKEIFDK